MFSIWVHTDAYLNSFSTRQQQEQQSQEMASIVVWAMCGDDIKYEVTSWHICTLLCLETRVVCCNTVAICPEILLQLTMFSEMDNMWLGFQPSKFSKERKCLKINLQYGVQELFVCE